MNESNPHPPTPAAGQQTLTRELRFPTRAELEAAVATVPTTTDKIWRQTPGPRFRLEVSPGALRITSTDYRRSSHADDRAEEARLRQTADMLAEDAKGGSGRGTTNMDWSRKSRARMPLRFATVDYSALFKQGDIAALVTLTYPGEWQRLVPTPKAFKDHVNALRLRYRGSWGQKEHEWAGIWKMEFQSRGAPHLHIGTTIPMGERPAPLSQEDLTHLELCDGCALGAHTGRFAFRDWLSRVWSYVIFKGHDEPAVPYSAEGWLEERRKGQQRGVDIKLDLEGRYSDPKRVGVYFAKHGLWEKEYQNHAPEIWKKAIAEGERGANFWGLWVVRPLIVSKEIRESLISVIVKHLRALADRSAHMQRTRWVKGGVNPRTGEIWEPRQRKRPVRRRVKRWRNRMGYGFELFNDPLVRLPDIARIIRHYGDAFVLDEASAFFDDPPGAASTVPDFSPALPPEAAPRARGDHLAVNDLGDFAGVLVGCDDGDRSVSVVASPL